MRGRNGKRQKKEGITCSLMPALRWEQGLWEGDLVLPGTSEHRDASGPRSRPCLVSPLCQLVAGIPQRWVAQFSTLHLRVCWCLRCSGLPHGKTSCLLGFFLLFRVEPEDLLSQDTQLNLVCHACFLVQVPILSDFTARSQSQSWSQWGASIPHPPLWLLPHGPIGEQDRGGKSWCCHRWYCLHGGNYARLFKGHRSNCHAVSTIILERHSELLCTAPSSGPFLNGAIASCEGTVSDWIIRTTVH